MKRIFVFVLAFMLFIFTGEAIIKPVADSTIIGSSVVEGNVIYVSDVMATITVPADTFMLAISVESSNDNGSIASAKNEAAIDKSISAIIAVGVDESDIIPGINTGISQSQSSNVECDKVGNDTICKTEKSSKNVLISTKYININSSNSDFVNKVLESARSSGANAVVVNYGLGDKNTAAAEARQKAIAEAELIAGQTASKRGMNLGAIQNVVSNAEYITYSDRLYMIEITSLIDISYELI